jgi:hypothetical protein
LLTAPESVEHQIACFHPILTPLGIDA